MYQLHVTVREYPGSYGVHAAISQRTDDGRVSLLGTHDEVLVEPAGQDEDPLQLLLGALSVWTQNRLK